MNKNTQILIGLGSVAVVGYLVYQQMNKNPEETASTGTTDNTSANFVNLTSRRKRKKRRVRSDNYSDDYGIIIPRAYPDDFGDTAGSGY